MLKTTKEFDFVYKNSYKFRSESLDICVLRANMAGQFYERFRKIPCSLVGFSVSKKVGNAVERNLIKRRLRAICREFFILGNSSLGMQFRTCANFGDFADSKSSLNSPKRSFLENPHKYKSHTENTRIVEFENAELESDSRGSIFDEKSGLRSHERGNKTNSLLTKQVASLPALSQKDNRTKDNAQNLICIFIAKSAILQTPFVALKSTIFATLKKQMHFMNNAHFAPKMANRYESPKRESTKMSNRPKSHTQGLMQNENR